MFWKVLFFFILFIGAYGVLTFYIGGRVYNAIDKSISLNKRAYWIVFSALNFSYFIVYLVRGYLPYNFVKYLTVITSYWIMAVFYSLVFMFILELFLLLDRKIDFIPPSIKEANDIGVKLVLILFVALVSIGIYGTYNASKIQTTTYVIETEKQLDREYNIVMLSDLHIGYAIGENEVEKMIEAINSLAPDYVFIAGDLIDHEWRPFFAERVYKKLKSIKSKEGVFMVNGNHESLANEEELEKKVLKLSEIELLDDSVVELDSNLVLIGRKDNSVNRLKREERMDLLSLVNDIDKDKLLIMMDHSPLETYEAKEKGIDLQLSGHTHAGQMYPFGVITERWFRLDYGKLTDECYNLIVSSGAGTWGPPVRIGTKSEIVSIKIKSAGINEHGATQGEEIK